jgi:hypothetical protein
VPTAADAAALGYNSAEVSEVPALLLSMLPAGPDLDTATASSGGGAAQLSGATGSGATGCGTAGGRSGAPSGPSGGAPAQ